MEIELIRQSLIVVENEKESAHTSEEELGVQSPFPYAEDSDKNTYLTNHSMGKVKIEDYEWKMRTIMHGEDNQVVVDAVGEDDPAHPEAKIIDMTLTAKDGKITITDHTNNKTYEGTYKVEQKTPAGTDYKVTIDGKEGYATVAMTTYADGTEEPTLPINLGTHSIYFYAE